MPGPTQSHPRRTSPRKPANTSSLNRNVVTIDDLRALRLSKNATVRFTIAAMEYVTFIGTRIYETCYDMPTADLADLLKKIMIFLDSIESLDPRIPDAGCIEYQMNDVLSRAETVDKQYHHLAARVHHSKRPVSHLPHAKSQTSVSKKSPGDSSSSSPTQKCDHSASLSVLWTSTLPLQPVHASRYVAGSIEGNKTAIAGSPSKRDAWYMKVGPMMASSDDNILRPPTPPIPQILVQITPQISKSVQHPRVPELKNVYRNTPSARYVCRESRGSNVMMPLPTRELEFCDEENKVIRSASFRELVRLLTSLTAIIDHELTTITFTWFRDFATPAAFFWELVNLYHEECPFNFNPKIWETNVVARRIRVAKAMLKWVSDYWDEENDGEVAILLRNFIKLADENDPVHSILTTVANHFPHPGHRTDALSASQNIFIKFAMEKFTKAFPPTGFKIPNSYAIIQPRRKPQSTASNRVDSSLEAASRLSFFGKSKEGREEFARQLTLLASAYFRLLKPAQTINIWRHLDSRDEEKWNKLPGSTSWSALSSFGQSLATWVSYTIVVPSERETRVSTIGFWIETALRCAIHRNFYCAKCILAGIEYSSVAKMKETILCVSRKSKLQFYTLREICGLARNFATYRALLEKDWAPIVLPFTDAHISDVNHIKLRSSQTTYEPSALIPLHGYRILGKVVKLIEKSILQYHFLEDKCLIGWLRAQISLFPPQKGQDTYSKELDFQRLKNEGKNSNSRLDSNFDVWECAVTTVPTNVKKIQQLDFKEKEKNVETFLKDFVNNTLDI